MKSVAVVFVVAILATTLPIVQAAEVTAGNDVTPAFTTSVNTSVVPNYTLILNHSIVVANRTLQRWGIPSNSTAWDLLRNATALLPKINEALLTNNVTLARKLFIDGMKLVAQAIREGAKESKNLKSFVRERLLITRRAKEYLAICRALNLSVKALNRTAYRLMKVGRINATTYDRIKEKVEIVSNELSKLKNYLIGVINGTNELNLTYVKHTLLKVRKELGFARSVIDRAVVKLVMERVKHRVFYALRFMEEKVERIMQIAKELKEKGLNTTATELEKIAIQLQERIRSMERVMNSTKGIALLARLAKEVMLRKGMVLVASKLAEMKHVEALPVINVKIGVVKVVRTLRRCEGELNNIIMKYRAQLPSDALKELKEAKEALSNATVKLVKSSIIPDLRVIDKVIVNVVTTLEKAKEALSNACSSMESSKGGMKKGAPSTQSAVNEVKDLMKDVDKVINELRKIRAMIRSNVMELARLRLSNLGSMIRITERLAYRIMKEVNASTNLDVTTKERIITLVRSIVRDMKRLNTALMTNSPRLVEITMKNLVHEVNTLVKIVRENGLTSVGIDVKILNNIVQHIISVTHSIVHVRT